ncbi:hypothetical protein [Amycolatopsis dongchuanensis]|uniref:hypothetical protein n=1 Tax=Amycolatopsis dongchuanensis TaxID=1070866 RepID=UPI0031F7CE03
MHWLKYRNHKGFGVRTASRLDSEATTCPAHGRAVAHAMRSSWPSRLCAAVASPMP